MKALILAAGFGTRLKPFTEHFPKPLVPVNGIPIILYNLAFLKSRGITEVMMNLHHQGEFLPQLLGDGESIGLKLSYFKEEKILGTGGGIKNAVRDLNDTHLLVANSDVIVDFDLLAMKQLHENSQNLFTILTRHHETPEQNKEIYFEEERITSILDRPIPSSQARGSKFASYYFLSLDRLKSILQNFSEGQQFCILRDVWIPQLEHNQSFGTFFMESEYWAVCDGLNDVQKTEKELKVLSPPLSYQKMLEEMRETLQNHPLYQRILKTRKEVEK